MPANMIVKNRCRLCLPEASLSDDGAVDWGAMTAESRFSSIVFFVCVVYKYEYIYAYVRIFIYIYIEREVGREIER